MRPFPALTDRVALSGALRVSPVCLGLVGSPEVIPAAFDAGINFFFLTADMHWPLYEATRRGLELLFERGVRDEVVVGVAAYVTQPDFCHAPYQEVVNAVAGLGRIDVSIAGGAYATDFWPRLGELRAHRRTGFVGVQGTGATFHDRATAATALEHGLVDIGFIRYNPAHRGAEEEVFPHPRRARLYGFNSTHGHLDPTQIDALGLAPSLWRPHITDRYRYALSRPELDGVLVGLVSLRELAELRDALARGPLTPEEAGYLADLADLAAGNATLAG